MRDTLSTLDMDKRDSDTPMIMALHDCISSIYNLGTLWTINNHRFETHWNMDMHDIGLAIKAHIEAALCRTLAARSVVTASRTRIPPLTTATQFVIIIFSGIMSTSDIHDHNMTDDSGINNVRTRSDRSLRTILKSRLQNDRPTSESAITKD